MLNDHGGGRDNAQRISVTHLSIIIRITKAFAWNAPLSLANRALCTNILNSIAHTFEKHKAHVWNPHLCSQGAYCGMVLNVSSDKHNVLIPDDEYNRVK